MPVRARAHQSLPPARARPVPPGAASRKTSRPGARARRRTSLRNVARATGGPRRPGRDGPRIRLSARPPSPAAGQRRDRCPLQRDEDPGAHVLLQPRHPRHELLVPEHESEPPARHAVALREREELDAHLACAGLGEKALRPAAVEDEIAVREVVEDGSVRPVGEGDRLGEDAVGRRRPVGFDG